MAKPAKSEDTVADSTPTEFIPADTFTGWPLGYEGHRRGTLYTAGVRSTAPAQYVALLREKGLVAEPVPVAEPLVVASEPTTEAVA